jgi:hypothetical protein
MSKKHYEAIAKAINHHVIMSNTEEAHIIKCVAEDIATIMAADNRAFNRGRFMQACGF